MLQQPKSDRDPIHDYLRQQEIEAARERRIVRAFLAKWDGLDALRVEMLDELSAAVSDKRRDIEEIRDLLYLLGWIGDRFTLDELLRFANPANTDDPRAIEWNAHPMFREFTVRAELMTAFGLLGQSLAERDADRLGQLTVVLRSGLADELPEVRIAAAIALARSVKYQKSAMEHTVKAVPALIEMLMDPLWQVKRAALEALTEIPDPTGIRALKIFGDREKDPHLRRFAENAQKRVRDRASYFRFVERPIQSLRDLLPGRG